MTGYSTKEPCDVCGKVEDNIRLVEFDFIVCKRHYKMPLNEIARVKNKRGNNK